MKEKKKKDGEKLEAIGHYQILKELGKGGMGTVYLGLQPSLNRQVAIKVLPGAFASDPDLVERFLRESQAIAALNHPNIIQIIDRGQEGESYYFVMEYMDGPSLAELLERGRLSLPQALDIISQTGQALEYAHSRDIIHRDIKPSNILLSVNEKVAKVADFGIARINLPGGGDLTLTQAHQGLGSLNYMAPEQRLDAGSVDQRADIYSLGVILYQMLTGQLPLGSFRLPSHFDRRIPPQLDRIILKCLRSNPEERYLSVRALMEDLNVERVKLVHLKGKVKDFFSAFGRVTGSLSGRILRKKSRRYVAAGGAGLLVAGVLIWLLTGPEAETPSTTPGDVSREEKEITAAPPALKKQFDYARSLLEGGMPEKALLELAVIVSEHPKAGLADDAQLLIGQTREAMGKYDEAVADYMKVISLFPESDSAPEAAFLIGMVYLEKEKDETRAVRALEEVVAKYPRSVYAPRALYKLALFQKSSGSGWLGGGSKTSSQVATLTLEKLVEEYPESDEIDSALIELGRLYDPDHLDQPEKSNLYYRRLHKQYPQTSYPIFYHLARNYEALGQVQKARDYYRKFLGTKPAGEEAQIAEEKLGELPGK